MPGTINIPLKVIWGEHDAALDIATAHASMQLCTDCELKVVPGASHFVQHDEPKTVNGLLLDFFSTEA